MKKALILITCLLLTLTMGIGSLPAAEKKGSQTQQVWSARASQKDYRIGASDILEITTWKEPDLVRDNVLVRTDGKISFPLLDDVQAAGLTPMEVKRNIEAGLKEFVAAPFVTVTVKAPNSRMFYILGEVSRTGEYVLTKPPANAKACRTVSS